MPTPDEAVTPPQEGTPTPRPLSNDAIDSMIARRGGSARKLIRHLLTEAHNAKQAAGVAVPTGGRVLTKAEAEQFQAFLDIGKPVADLRTALSERDTLSAEKRERTAFAPVEALARTQGYNATLLAKLAKADGATLEVKQIAVRENGKTTNRDVIHVVTGTGTDAKATPLDEYRAEHWRGLVGKPKPGQAFDDADQMEDDDDEDTADDDEQESDDARDEAPAEDTSRPVVRRSYPVQGIGKARKPLKVGAAVTQSLNAKYDVSHLPGVQQPARKSGT